MLFPIFITVLRVSGLSLLKFSHGKGNSVAVVVLNALVCSFRCSRCLRPALGHDVIVVV